MTMIWTDADHLEDLKSVIKAQEQKLAEMQMDRDAAYKALTHAQCDLAYAMYEGPRGYHLLQLRFDTDMLKFNKYAIESLMQVVVQKLAPFVKHLQDEMKDGRPGKINREGVRDVVPEEPQAKGSEAARGQEERLP